MKYMDEWFLTLEGDQDSIEYWLHTDKELHLHEDILPLHRCFQIVLFRFGPSEHLLRNCSSFNTTLSMVAVIEFITTCPFVWQNI